MYRKIEPGARKANGCIPPSDIYLRCLSAFPSRVLSASWSLFFYCHRVLHVFRFSFSISNTTLHTTLLFHLRFQSLCLQLYSVSQITFQLSSTQAFTVSDSVIPRIYFFMVLSFTSECWWFLMCNRVFRCNPALCCAWGILMLKQENIKSKAPPAV